MQRAIARLMRSSGALAILVLAAGRALPQPATLAFTAVTVIDGRDSVPRRNQNVVVRWGRIVAAGPLSAVRIPAGARVIHGRGKFLVPGLWDMHVHTDVPRGRDVLALYVVNGVTGVRDMAGRWDTLRAWRTDIAAGRLTGPRIVASGPYLEGGDVPIPHLKARTVDEAHAAVDSLIRLGAPFIKVHGQLRPEVYFAIARRARERRVPLAGHVSQAVGAQAASDSGQRSIEHLLGIPVPCTAAESLALVPRYPLQAALGRCTSRDLTPLYQSLVANGTWVTPTLTAAYEIAQWPRRALPGDSVAGYLPDSLKQLIREIFPMPANVPRGADSVGRAMFALRQTQVVAMRRAGVGILTGTDAPLRNAPPGFGLHEELRLLARAGLSPFDVLRAATLEPARWFAATDSMGTIAAGQVADLLLLDANPLVDVRNLARIAAVVAGGRLYDATDRRRILRAARTRR